MLYRCEQCDGHMETEDDMSGVETVGCPHCGFDTRLIPVRTLTAPPLHNEQPTPTTNLTEPGISPKESEGKLVYRMQGSGSSSLEVYDDRVAIITQGIISGGGVETIPFSSITAVQMKQAGLDRGGLEFMIPGGSKGTNGIAYTNGFFLTHKNDELAFKIKTYVESRIRELRITPKNESLTSLPDEISKLANLRTQGILSEEEFQAAKKRLLSR